MYTQYQKQTPVAVRISPISNRTDRQRPAPEKKSGSHVLIATLVVIFAFVLIASLRSGVSHAASKVAVIKSGETGKCMDALHSGSAYGTLVQDYSCNNTSAQAWQVGLTTIKHDDLCLSVSGNSKLTGAGTVLEGCNGDPGQVWIRDDGGFYNPNSEQCLRAPSSGSQLILASCNQLGSAAETWSSSQNPLDCSLYATRANKVACSAISEWNNWHTGASSHKALLNAYTDGAPYEEWCADFTSYVYKEAGYPFDNGEADGWDESNANYIQNQGFTAHSPSSYIPQVGDVAYFDYEGGHVEIVISGGKTPSFIYGNSAAVDPSTGNGQMASNTKTSDGSLGKLVYYLSPN